MIRLSSPNAALRALVAGSLLLLALVAGTRAEARTEAESRYSKAQTYSAALRYLRVNLSYEVTEKDAEAAYLLFRYVPQGKREPTSGAIEIVETREGVKLLVQLPTLPSYHEIVIRDGLLEKLRSDYGEPPKRTRPKEPPPDDKPEGPGEGERDPEGQGRTKGGRAQEKGGARNRAEGSRRNESRAGESPDP
jgi:hypothetical protein